jgi:hypothetical protein
MAWCHPDRPEARKTDGLCNECVLEEKQAIAKARRRKAGGAPLLSMLMMPKRIVGVRQNAVTEIPEKCDKCGNRFLLLDGRRVYCPGARAGCGQDWFLVEGS